jgi:hypothetical protein
LHSWLMRSSFSFIIANCSSQPRFACIRSDLKHILILFPNSAQIIKNFHIGDGIASINPTVFFIPACKQDYFHSK